jgi:hypothetical protein
MFFFAKEVICIYIYVRISLCLDSTFYRKALHFFVKVPPCLSAASRLSTPTIGHTLLAKIKSQRSVLCFLIANQF